MDFATLDQSALVVEKFPALPFAKKASQRKHQGARARSFPTAPDARGAVGQANRRRTQIYRRTAISNMPAAAPPVLFSSSNLRSPLAGKTTIARRTSRKAPRRWPRKV